MAVSYYIKNLVAPGYGSHANSARLRLLEIFFIHNLSYIMYPQLTERLMRNKLRTDYPEERFQLEYYLQNSQLYYMILCSQSSRSQNMNMIQYAGKTLGLSSPAESLRALLNLQKCSFQKGILKLIAIFLQIAQ